MSATVTTELAPTKKGRAELAEQISFSPQQLQLMKNTVAKGATDDEFLLLLHLAKTYGLDPFAKEIWCIKYGNQAATIFSSRDGYLKIASRDPQMDGIQSDAVCANDSLEKLTDGTVMHTYGNPRGTLVGAYALVFRKDRSRPAYFYAPMAEYNAGGNPTWKKYPTAMIIKVAEAMALKRAFSISGLVTQEEMGLDMTHEPDAGTGAEVVTEPAAAAPARVQVPGTVSTQAEIDEREIAGHRIRFEHAQNLVQVQQIWKEIPKHLAPKLVVDKDSAKLRLSKPAPQTPTPSQDLVADFIEKPSIEGTPANDYQRQEIQRLAALQPILPKEQADILKVLYKLDSPRANQLIFRLRNEIAKRDGIDPDKATRQALHSFITNRAEQLGTDEVDRLTALKENGEVHWQVLYDELQNAKALLHAVPA